MHTPSYVASRATPAPTPTRPTDLSEHYRRLFEMAEKVMPPTMNTEPDPDLQRIVEAMAPEDHSLTIPDPLPALRWLIETAQNLDEESLTMVTMLAQRLLTLQRLAAAHNGRELTR